MADVTFQAPATGGGEFRLHISGAFLELYQDNTLVQSTPLASINSFTLNGGSGNETLLIDELILLPGGIFFNGNAQSGPPGDAITVMLPGLDSSTVTYTNATDGGMVLSDAAGTMTVTFTGLDPIDMSGSTVSDLVFNLPGGTTTQLEDNGNPVDGSSQLRDADVSPGFDTTSFSHPTGSLTINNGSTADAVHVNLVESLGAIALAINVGAPTTFTNFGTGSPPLASVTTDAAGTVVFNTSVTTTGAQTYHDAATLGANTVLTSTGVGDIEFSTTLDGAFDLVVNTAGGSNFFGVVGGLALASITTDAAGLTRVAANVTTTGDQTYGDQLALFGNVALTSTAAGTLSFPLIDNNFTLALNTSGATILAGAVGSLATLDALATNAGGTTAIDGGSVRTNNAQTYNDAVTLGDNTVLTSTGAGNLIFGDTVNGAFSLAANTAGITLFSGAVGGGMALAAVTTDAAGTTALNGGSVTTTGAQTYHDAVSLGAITNLTGSEISFGSTVANNGFSLTVTESGTGQFSGAISGGGGLTKAGGGTTSLAAANTYGGATTINAGTLLVDGSIVNSTTTVNSGGTLGGHGTTGVVNVASGGHLAPGNSPGLLSTGNLSLVSGATFEEEIGGTAAGSGYDQVRVNGSVNLGNATLNISLVNSFVVTATDNFTIIDNDGSDAVTGQFAGLVEGARLAVGSRTFIITYHGGDGNDVVLKALKDTGQDFNADGMGDIFWEVDGGPLAIWEMNAAQIAFADYTRAGSSAVGRPAADWHVVDTGDLNGDGKSDVLWRTDGGALALWQMDGSQITAADYLRRGATQLGTPAADWHALGVLDADGDSKSDILWRTDSGALAIWEMDGNQLKSADYIRLGSTAVGVPAPDWNIVGTGDFDSDGKGDILWRTDGGALAVWLLDGIQIKSAQYLKTGSVNVAAPGADWHISDVADFNGDGRADILWRIGAAQTGDLPPGGGQVAIWEMNGNQVAFADYTRLGSTVVGAPATDWHLLGADDYSGDRKADLLWRTDGGALAIWQMDGTHVASAGFTQAGSTPTGAPGSNWHVYQHHYDLV